MSGDIEYGKCDICGDMNELTRKYYHYPINCECHSPNHFEIVYHCNNCEPEEPKFTNVTFRTEQLNKKLNEDELVEQFINHMWEGADYDDEVWKDDIKYEKNLIKKFLKFQRENGKKY